MFNSRYVLNYKRSKLIKVFGNSSKQDFVGRFAEINTTNKS